MKNIFRFLRLLWTLKRRERDAQIQRFEKLEVFLFTCNTDANLNEYDALEKLTLRSSDYGTKRFYDLQAARGEKERDINGFVIGRQKRAINEWHHFTYKYKMQ